MQRHEESSQTPTIFLASSIKITEVQTFLGASILRKHLKLLLTLLIFPIMSGCVPKHHSTLNPTRDLKDSDKILIQMADRRDDFNLYNALAQELELLGFHPALDRDVIDKESYDTTIRYVDNWQWDMTMYLLRLRITASDLSSYELIGESEVERPSLYRCSAKKMVREALAPMLYSSEREKTSYIEQVATINPRADLSQMHHFYIVESLNSHDNLLAELLQANDLSYEVGGPQKSYPPQVTTLITSSSLWSGFYYQFRDAKTNQLQAEVSGCDSTEESWQQEDKRRLKKIVAQIKKNQAASIAPHAALH